MAEKIVKTDEEWKKLLTPEQFEVARKKGTERAFTGKYWDFHDQGVYLCVCCGNELFNSETKFDSGCGWPSFLCPQGREQGREQRGQELRNGADRGDVQPLRRAPGARFRRRPEPHGIALLHELGVAEI